MFAVIDQKYCVPSQVDLIMEEKMFTFIPDEFKIRDRDHRIFFQLKGQMFSFGNRKLLLDKDGHEIAGLRKVFFKLSNTYACYKDNHDIFLVVQKLFSLFLSLSVNVVNQFTGQSCKVKVCGDWRTKEFRVYVKETNQTLAVVSRTFTDLKSLVRQKYVLSILPGVDAAFVVMLVLAIAEIRNLKSF